MATCKGRKKDGTPCRSPIVLDNGYCRAHQDQAPEAKASEEPVRWTRERLEAAIAAHGSPEGLNLADADLSDLDLSQMDLHGIVLSRFDEESRTSIGANLQKASLGNANLHGARLYGVNLQGASLRHASLQEAELEGADLQRARLEGANLQRASLYGANVQEASLRHANVQGASLEQAVYLPQVAPEQGWGREEMLENLCMKAGLSKEAWKKKGTRFYVFTAEVFEEGGTTDKGN